MNNFLNYIQLRRKMVKINMILFCIMFIPAFDLPNYRVFDEGEWKVNAQDNPQALHKRCLPTAPKHGIKTEGLVLEDTL